MPTVKQLYRHFIEEHSHPYCWACGRGHADRPDRWFADWWLDRAHIVNKPRVEDVRLVVILCRLCHSRFAGATISACNGHHWPKLTLANLLWLKLKFDADNYDREFLQRYSVRKLPRAVAPAAVYLEEYKRRRAA